MAASADAHDAFSASRRRLAFVATAISAEGSTSLAAAASAEAPRRYSDVTRTTWIRRLIESSRLFHPDVMCLCAAAPSPL